MNPHELERNAILASGVVPDFDGNGASLLKDLFGGNLVNEARIPTYIGACGIGGGKIKALIADDD